MAAATAEAVTTPVIHLHDCTYTSCYCEENIYLLIKRLLQQQQQHQQHVSHLFAIFISNPSETVPFWYQRASQHADGFVVWDYHVIALEVQSSSSSSSSSGGGGQAGACLIWDLDLKHPQLPFPCSLQQYAQHALQAHSIQLPQQYQRCFRLVPAASLLQHFASDRSHMHRPDGSWCAPPPPYPCITAADGTAMNLARYRDMSRDVMPDAIASRGGGDTMGIASQLTAAAAATTVGEGVTGPPCAPAAALQCHQPQQQQQQQQQCHQQQCNQPQQQQQQQQNSSCAGGPLSSGSKQGGPIVKSASAAGIGSSSLSSEGAGVRLVTWQNVATAAAGNRYGVVLHEHTLLRCLLGRELGG